MKTKNCFFILVAAVFLFAANISAQVLGVRVYNEATPYSQEFKKIIHTSDGGILAVGSQGYAGRVTKLDSSLVQTWAFGLDSIALMDAVQTNDGNYVLVGLALTTTYYNAVYVTKITPAGTLIFQKRFSTGANNQFTTDGICKAAGSDSGFVLFGGNCSAMHYLIKCDKNGNQQWSVQHVGLGNGTYVAMIAESNGYVAELNYLGSSADVGIAKIDVNGNLLWCKVYETTNGVAVYRNSLVKKNNGDYFIFTEPNDSFGVQDYLVAGSGNSATCTRHINGSTQVETTCALATGNASDEILMTGVLSPGKGTFMKVSSSDVIIYQDVFTLFSSYFNAAVVAGNGRYVLGGSTGSYGKMVARIDENGNGVCATAALTMNTSSRTFNTIAVTVTNVPVNPTVDVTSVPLYPVTQAQSNLCGTLSIDPVSAVSPGISVFPNPSTGQVTIASVHALIQQVKIVNAVGQTCFSSAALNVQQTTVDFSGYDAGIYFVQVFDGEKWMVEKVVKE